MNPNLFRKTSLEKLQSPEQLDRLITVTSPRSWLILAGIFALIFMVVTWSVVGSLPTKVYGQGILLKSGGVQTISAKVSGQITDVSVRAGDEVERGEVIARMEQPELLSQIAGISNELDAYRELNTDGSYADRIHSLEAQLAQLQNELELFSEVESPFAGRVIEIKVDNGDFVSQGEAIISLEMTGEEIKDLEGIFYVSPREGKTIHTGMEVKISPASIKKEEFGFMVGRVTSVADYPSTSQGMMRVLGNPDLVESLSGNGAPIQVTVTLIPDSQTTSGYKWTTPGGPPVEIRSGTLSNAIITIEETRPIGMVFPQFK